MVGQTVRALAAVADLLQGPRLAAGDRIPAIPTLVRRLPVPLTRIIVDLSRERRAPRGLRPSPLQPVPDVR